MLIIEDVVELILEKLGVKDLVRFKCVSKKWKSTIESRRFKDRQLSRRRESRGPDVLLVSLNLSCDGEREDQTSVLGSSTVSTVRFPKSGSIICHGSCDGLLCLYCIYEPSVVVNPATRWYQSFPLSNFQQILIDSYDKEQYGLPTPHLGFGKDKVTATYKPVWLYNSSDYGLENVTTCEVLDFSKNAWRYVHPSSPYRIDDYHYPVYLDGSLHWLTEGEDGEAKVISLDLHTETFQVLCKAPFSSHESIFFGRFMCVLDDRLCVTEKNCPTQVIWSFDSSSSSWKKLCSIDLTQNLSCFVEPHFPLAPIAILDKNKLLLQSHNWLGQPVIHDLDAKSYGLLFKPDTIRGYPVYYYQSLFTALSN